jgi:hypothetical protein
VWDRVDETGRLRMQGTTMTKGPAAGTIGNLLDVVPDFTG